MSKLEELIARLCPDGVEYKELVNCCEILDNKRKPVTKSARVNGVYPYYGANGIQDYVADYIFDGDFVLVGEDGSVVNKDGTPVVTWASGKIWVNNHAHIITGIESVLLRYLYHYLQTVNVSVFIHGNIPKLTGKDFKAIKVPVPPLEVQREIVHILDSYTASNKELKEQLDKELAARQKQYEWYKRKLIEDASEMRDLFKLNDVASYVKERITTKIINKNNYVGVENLLQDKKGKTDASSIPSTGSVIGFEKDDILLGNIRPYLKKIWFANIEGGTNGDVLAIRANTKFVLPKYLYYILSTDTFFLYDNSHSKGAKMPRGNKDAIMDYEFLLPPLSEQQRIVDILDRFDALCNDITSGLPAEIEARKKQYEYYRDKLLTFKELKKEA